MSRVRLPLLAALSLPILQTSVLAAGYAVREASVPAMGSAYAGASARSDDPSFIAYNPASVSGVEAWDAAVGFIAAWPQSDASYPLATTGAATPAGGASAQDGFVQPAYVPDLSFRYRLDDAWTLGLSVGAPWGLTTIYDRTWAGRYHGHETELLSVALSPAVAYRISDTLTAGAAIHAQYAVGRLSNAIDVGTIGAALAVPGAVPGAQDGYGAFEAEDWAWGFSFGLLWRPSPDVVAGASFRSRVEMEMTGPVTFDPGTSPVGTALTGLGLLSGTRGATNLTTPAQASLGVVWSLSPEVDIAGEAGFTDWSEFEELRVRFANPLQPDEVTRFDWKDAWFGAVGVKWKPLPGWAFSAGLAYDETPSGGARNVRIPDASRTWAAIGVQTQITERTTLSLSYAHLFLDPEPVRLVSSDPGNAFRGSLSGTTDASADVVGIALTFR